METKYYLIEMYESSHGYVSFYEEFQAQSFDDALEQAKIAYPNSEMYNVYISANDVSKSEGGSHGL